MPSARDKGGWGLSDEKRQELGQVRRYGVGSREWAAGDSSHPPLIIRKRQDTRRQDTRLLAPREVSQVTVARLGEKVTCLTEQRFFVGVNI
jgi:hypothetical protein